MSSGNVTTALARAPWRFLTSRWPWLSLIYLVISAALGLVLLPLLVFTFLILPLWALGIGGLERHRTRLLGFASQASGHIPVDELERHHWLGIRLTEAATWREALALLVDLVLGLAALVILFFQGIGIAVLVGAAGAGLNGPTDIQVIGDVHAVMTPANWWLTLPIGLGWLCLLAYLNATLAAVQASTLRLLCGPHPQELDEKLQRVLRSRRTLAEAAEAERRRIERDLHDGVQQELIVLGARLGMINLELDELEGRGLDLSDAQRAVEAAQTQAERTMSTLRNTVRGIHPAVLTDLGLSAALEELAERHPTPVALTLEHNTRLPAVVETTAYYLACEALTNASKHATPTTIHLRTMLKDNTFSITVTDDGAGGAEEMAGVGLRGLRDRAEALNGHLQLTSPVGGPTEVRLELPCAS